MEKEVDAIVVINENEEVIEDLSDVYDDTKRDNNKGQRQL